MPVTTSYPGLYVEELPLSAHSISAAPTSIAAFVGYSHPYRTKAFGVTSSAFRSRSGLSSAARTVCRP